MESRNWVYFVASADDKVLKPFASAFAERLSRYQVREVVAISGDLPANLDKARVMFRIETIKPLSTMSTSILSGDNPVVVFQGVTEHLHYTSTVQHEELNRHSPPEPPPSANTTAVLIPIAKSEDWWKLPQDQRQAHFQKTASYEGHTEIGLRYADRIFRKLYHSRYLDPEINYDFLTYFEFTSSDERNFRKLLNELRDTSRNPEWGYVTLEYEIWMTKSW